MFRFFEEQQMADALCTSGILVKEVRIYNFRSLKQVSIKLDRVNILIGENNSGKTSFLDAIHTAIGLGRRNITQDDIFLDLGERSIPKIREVIIDILIRPVDQTGDVVDGFPEGSFWIELWGNGISQDDSDNDFVGIRTRGFWSEERREFTTERQFLQSWSQDPSNLEGSKVKEVSGIVSTRQLEPIALYLMDAKRDIQDEIYKKGSFWNRLVSDLDLTEEEVDDLEAKLLNLNEEISGKCQVLKHVQGFLSDIDKTISCDRSSIKIDPIPRSLRNLSKGSNINFATLGAQSFPLSKHGMGTRSLAVLLTFRAYMTWRQGNPSENRIHPFLGLEEPESHLHPQAQRALFKQTEEIPGQCIISTHSPYIASQAKIALFRHFRKEQSQTIVTQIDTSSLLEEDLRKIDRMVMNTRGDLLYARAIILFEGETEEQALPEFGKRYFDAFQSALGLSYIGVGGAGNYLPFLRLASSFNIPWYIFSDAEQNPLNSLSAALRQIGISDYSRESNIFVLNQNQNFESYLIDENYDDAINSMLDSVHGVSNYLDEYKALRQGQNKKGGGTRDYQVPEGNKIALKDILSEGKTQYGLPLAQSILSLPDQSRRFPGKIKQLLDKISDDLNLSRSSEV